MMRFLSAFVLMAITALSGQTSWAAESAADPGGVLVFGGSGRTGAFVVDELLNRGEAVTVFVRPTSDRSRLEAPFLPEPKRR